MEQQITVSNERRVISMEEAPIYIDGLMVTGNTKTDPVLALETNDPGRNLSAFVQNKF